MESHSHNANLTTNWIWSIYCNVSGIWLCSVEMCQSEHPVRGFKLQWKLQLCCNSGIYSRISMIYSKYTTFCHCKQSQLEPRAEPCSAKNICLSHLVSLDRLFIRYNLPVVWLLFCMLYTRSMMSLQCRQSSASITWQSNLKLLYWNQFICIETGQILVHTFCSVLGQPSDIQWMPAP